MSLEISWSSVKYSNDVVLILDARRGVLRGFDVDLTATGLLDVAVPVDREKLGLECQTVLMHQI